jgi:4-amino-4-deoxychorismate lyase
MRRAVLEAARALGVGAAECELSLPDVLAADELFVTNALFGIWPIAAMDAHRFAVGPLTRRLMSSLGYGHDA